MSLSSATRECAYLTTKISCLIRLNWTKLHVFYHSLSHWASLLTSWLLYFGSSNFPVLSFPVMWGGGKWNMNPDTLSTWTFKIMFHSLKNTTYFWMLFLFVCLVWEVQNQGSMCRKATLASSSVVFLSLCFFFLCRWY